MRLFVMRHGPAVDGSAFGRDFDRTLSEAGRVCTRRVAEELARRGERPLRIVSSPLVRAVETARIVAETLGGPSLIEERPELAPSEDARGLVRELSGDDTESALLVSHAPDVTLLAEAYLDRAVGAFSPARIVAIDLEERRGKLRFVIEPSR